jgi:hypothetical protein
MLTERPAPPRRLPPARGPVREIRTALRQLDVYVAEMTDPADERLLAAAAALFAQPPFDAPRGDVAA